MIYFGWPHAHEDDAERCLRAALEIVQAVKDVSAEARLAVRIGVATGTVVVGDASRMANGDHKLAVGETPNLASRLQELAVPDEVVIAPGTRRLVGDALRTHRLGPCTLKGIAEPVPGLARGRAAPRPKAASKRPAEGSDSRRWWGARKKWRCCCAAGGRLATAKDSVVLIGGEPGIGKSRSGPGAARADRRRAVHHPALPVLALPPQLRPVSHHRAASSFSRVLPATTPPSRNWTRWKPCWWAARSRSLSSAPLFAGPALVAHRALSAAQLSPQKQKEKTLEMLADQVEARSHRQPVLMVFEDVHWIDPTSQEAARCAGSAASRRCPSCW